MTTQSEITRTNHRRAVRFFWVFLIGATTVSLLGNIAHAVLPYLPTVAIQIGAAAVPPIALLAAVHGIALAVRAGASGTVYRWAVTATAAIGAGAFSVSFLALRDLMYSIGYSSTTAWIFPAIVDTAVAVGTVMLVALGGKPTRRTRPPAASAVTRTSTVRGWARRMAQGAIPEVNASASHHETQPMQAKRAQTSASVRPGAAQALHASAQLSAAQVGAEDALGDTDLALDLIASGATTQPVDTVLAVLSAHRGGASINAAAKAARVNFRTAQRIVAGAEERRQRLLVAIG
ncbi:hypothetical protein AU191_08775 [Mycolicibacterium acapulense]|nr:hypothetical protein AU191_08775 [Mycolicibacterium acapulense]